MCGRYQHAPEPRLAWIGLSPLVPQHDGIKGLHFDGRTEDLDGQAGAEFSCHFGGDVTDKIRVGNHKRHLKIMRDDQFDRPTTANSLQGTVNRRLATPFPVFGGNVSQL